MRFGQQTEIGLGISVLSISRNNSANKDDVIILQKPAEYKLNPLSFYINIEWSNVSH